jgi:membrane associated rhomboid family serine protease
MIPLRDTTQSRSYPVVNMAIIVANCLVYFIQAGQEGPRLNEFIMTYGLVPARYSLPAIRSFFTTSQQLFSFLSFMFLHGGFWHLLGNMWSLYIFGDNVEDRLGSVRYLFFYLLCGVASGLSHLLLNWRSPIPTVGASGAIAGVMGAYFLLYPRSRVLTLIPILFLPYLIEIPAYFFLGLWFVMQFLSATLAPAGGGGIAWWAHIGGFLFGMVLLKLFLTIPESGFSRRLRNETARRKSHRLQMVKPPRSAEARHLFASLFVTPQEAATGARKLVSIPSGRQRRLFRVTIPPGAPDGMVLRLSGAGEELDDGGRGDLYLRMRIQGDQKGSEEPGA